MDTYKGQLHYIVCDVKVRLDSTVDSDSTFIHVGTVEPINMNSKADRESAKPVINSVCNEKIRCAYASMSPLLY